MHTIFNTAGKAFWLQGKLFDCVCEIENQKMLADIRFWGDRTLLVLEHIGFAQQLQGCQTKIIANNTFSIKENHDLFCRFEKLGIESNSIDCIWLPHILEYENNPYEILREIYRILKPYGHLIINQFNPYGTAMIPCFWSRFQGQQQKLLSAKKLKQWLSLLGFQILKLEYLGYGLAISKQWTYFYPKWFANLCRFTQFSISSMIYTITACKQTIGMTPIGADNKILKISLSPNIVESLVIRS